MTKHINLVTGNPRKIEEATATLNQYDIAVEIINLDIDEIQHRDPLKIIEAKVRTAHEKVGKPVVVNDSNWEVLALGGFPGGLYEGCCALVDARGFFGFATRQR